MRIQRKTNKLIYILSILLICCSVLGYSENTYADNAKKKQTTKKKDAFPEIDLKGDLNPWDFLNMGQNGVTVRTDGVVADTAGDAVYVLTSIGLMGAVVMIALGGYMIILSQGTRRGSQRNEHKSAILWRCFLIIVLLEVPTIMGVIYNIALKMQ